MLPITGCCASGASQWGESLHALPNPCWPMLCWLVSNGHNFTPGQSLNWRHRSDLVENEHGSLIRQNVESSEQDFLCAEDYFSSPTALHFSWVQYQYFNSAYHSKRSYFWRKYCFGKKIQKQQRKPMIFFRGKGQFQGILRPPSPCARSNERHAGHDRQSEWPPWETCSRCRAAMHCGVYAVMQ